MKRLLIITPNCMSSVSSESLRISRICKYLDSSRWSISLLTLKEKHYPVSWDRVNNTTLESLGKLIIYGTEKLDLLCFLLKIRDNVRNIFGNKPRNNFYHPASEDHCSSPWKKTPVQSKKGLWQGIKFFFIDIFQFPDKHITWLPLAVWKGVNIIHRDNVDVIFSSSPPHSLHLISTILKILTGKKLVVDFRDPWARLLRQDEKRITGAYERWKHQRIIQMERWVVTKADEVILVTREMRNDFVRSYPQLPPYKFNYFPMGYDPENMLSVTAVVNSNGVNPAKIIFVHTGSLHKHCNPTPILYALKNLFELGAIERNKISFQFIGGIASYMKHIPALAVKLKVDDVVQFLSPLSYQKVMEYMAESHILILLHSFTKLQLPSEFFDYLCLGKPILAVAEKDSAIEHIIKDGYGIFADFNDVKEVEKAILFLYNRPYYNTEYIREKRNIFNFSEAIENFMAILDA